MTTDAMLRSFAAFLSAGWEGMKGLIGEVDQFDDLVSDWMQANWEILVEAVLLPGGREFLEVYGDGADCNGASSRVFRQEALPTHRIRCLPRSGERLRDLSTGRLIQDENMLFWGFVHWNGNTYSLGPRFNAVLLEGKDQAVLDLDKLEFQLEEIKSA